jgi:hypothetical protein
VQLGGKEGIVGRFWGRVVIVVVIEGGGGNKEEWNTVLWPYTLTGARTAFICMYSGAFFAF